MVCIKKPKKPINKFIMSVAIITIFSMSFSLAGFIKVNSDNLEKNNQMVIDNIYGIGEDLSKSVQDIIDQIYYEIKLYSLSEGLIEMDEIKIAKQMNFIMSSKQRYDGVVVLNKDRDIVYGYVENAQNFKNSNVINKTISTRQIQVQSIFEGGQYKVDVYNPIINTSSELVGVLCLRINIKELNDTMKRCRLDEYSEAYIVDENGTFLTESKYVPGAIGKEKIDIDRVKLNIDYSRYTPYEDYRGEMVYGAYFKLNHNSDWTLIVEVDKRMMEDITEKNSKSATVLATLQGLLLVIVQMLLKKFLGIDFNLSNITQNGNLDYEKLTETVEKIIDKEEKENKVTKD